MTQQLYRYRPRGRDATDERLKTEWFRKGEAPRELRGDDGTYWDLDPERPRDDTQRFKCMREGIRSIQLPRWWPFAKHHDKDGACIFENETEAKEAVRRARDAGEPVAWDN